MKARCFEFCLSILTELLISVLFCAYNMLSKIGYVLMVLGSKGSLNLLNILALYYKNLCVIREILNFNFLSVSEYIFLFSNLKLGLVYTCILKNVSLYSQAYKRYRGIYPSSFTSVHFWTKIEFFNVVKCRWGYWGAVSSWPKKLVLFPEIDQVKFFY